MQKKVENLSLSFWRSSSSQRTGGGDYVSCGDSAGVRVNVQITGFTAPTHPLQGSPPPPPLFSSSKARAFPPTGYFLRFSDRIIKHKILHCKLRQYRTGLR